MSAVLHCLPAPATLSLFTDGCLYVHLKSQKGMAARCRLALKKVLALSLVYVL